ncbi:MAG TPA: cupin domain-containing protein [Gemmatimonadaceae bacterium]|jgi:quercetin dioxygenase-like cupin family protein
MQALSPREASRQARAASPNRPTITVLADLPDARLMVIRLAPGQAVPPHHNASTVIVTVLEGQGVLSGAAAERRCATGDVVVYEPSETHGIRATDAELLVLVTVAPGPGKRSGAQGPPMTSTL